MLSIVERAFAPKYGPAGESVGFTLNLALPFAFEGYPLKVSLD